jgi:hypothetical protein
MSTTSIPIFSRWAIAGIVALAAYNVPARTQAAWSDLVLAKPNKGAWALTGGPASSACTSSQNDMLNALGVKSADAAALGADCPEEFAVFRKSAAMELIAFPPGTVPDGALPKTNRRQAALRFVILTECFDENGNATSFSTCAKRELTFANSIFNEERTGITFPSVRAAGLFTNGIGTPGADALKVNCDDPANVAALQAIAPTTSTTITVYYIGDVSGPTAWTCLNGEMIIMSGAPSSDSLAHEFGHSFALNLPHYNPMTPDGLFDNRNLMIGSDLRGQMLTLGQSFRFNLGTVSMLNQSTTSLSLRSCDATTTAQCPPLELDAR